MNHDHWHLCNSIGVDVGLGTDVPGGQASMH